VLLIDDPSPLTPRLDGIGRAFYGPTLTHLLPALAAISTVGPALSRSR
jgi:hypothetical protein